VNMETRRAAHGLGVRGEERAALLLRFKGYKILARRFSTYVGEVDIVALKRRCLVFVEVKARPTLELAAESIRHSQRARIARGAEAFVSRHPHYVGYDMRFDAVLVAPGRLPRHLKAAFDAGR
jgi:putative endonuclease